MPDLDQPIEYVKGIGPRKAELLKKAFSVTTVGDLILQYPFRYIDKTNITLIKNIKPITPVTPMKTKTTTTLAKPIPAKPTKSSEKLSPVSPKVE